MAATDPAIHGSGDESVVEIEFRLDQIALRSLQRGPASQRRRYGIIDILFADSLFLKERFHASQVLLGLDELGLSLGNSGFAAEVGGSEGHRIDEIQPVIYLDVPALGKKDFLDNAGDLWPNFHGPESLRLPDKLWLVRDCLSGHCNHFHLGDWWGRRGRFL
jgi:hypothetical protein